MSKKRENLSLLSQLDDTERGGVISEEEAEEIGAAYGSRERYEEVMRNCVENISGTPGYAATVPVGMGEKRTRIAAGTTTVPLGDLPKIKRINIVGKTLTNAYDAARLFSSFRDPRIEIFNIAYTSFSGEVLCHTAWTSGLPSVSLAVEEPTSFSEGIKRIQRMGEKLNADKAWIAHNHPSGNPTPSSQDLSLTQNYAYHL
jgi:hypothetical protein